MPSEFGLRELVIVVHGALPSPVLVEPTDAPLSRCFTGLPTTVPLAPSVSAGLLPHPRDPLQERVGRGFSGPRMAPETKTRGAPFGANLASSFSCAGPQPAFSVLENEGENALWVRFEEVVALGGRLGDDERRSPCSKRLTGIIFAKGIEAEQAWNEPIEIVK